MHKAFSYSDFGKRSGPLVIQQNLSEPDKVGESISFAAGLPDPALFPLAELQESFLRQTAVQSNYQYSLPSHRLKEQIKELMKGRGVNCDIDQIMITNGAQQGISLLVRLFFNPKQNIIIEPFVYPGFKQIIDPFQPKFIEIQSDNNNLLNLNSLEDLCIENGGTPLFYTVVNGHNPLSTSLDTVQKKKLVDIASRYNFPLIEDDPYGWLSYENDDSTPMIAHDSQGVYIGSFSKILVPSFRVGWIIAPPEIIRSLGYLKDQMDVNCANFIQYVVADYLDHNSLYDHISLVTKVYKSKRDTAIETISKYFPSCIEFFVPRHGIFLWIEFKETIDLEKVQDLIAKQYKISYFPGTAFSINPDRGRNALRINFSLLSEEKLIVGLKILGETFQKLLLEPHLSEWRKVA